MGASKSKTISISICPSRVKASGAPVKSDAVPISTKTGSDTEIIATKGPAKEVKTAAESVKLPTNSWRELLKEAPDKKPGIKQDDEKTWNVCATPFVPKQAPTVQAAPAATHKSVEADTDEPEWMQYLAKKINSKRTPAPPPNPPSTKLSSGKNWPRSNAEGLSGEPGGGSMHRRDPSEVEDSPSGSNVVIHTESYLKLLKDGASKKKASGTSAETNRKKLADKSGLALVPTLGRKQAPAVQENYLTASNLAQKWSNAVNKTPRASNELLNPSDEPQRATQDDIAISKMLCDADLSDPCYYSDTEPTDTKCSGAVHRFGRRPKMAKASIRSYVMQDMSYRLDEVVGMLLLRLQRFTDQHRILSGPDAQPEQVNKSRRFVIGLKEVSRRTRQSKIDCLIVAPDIEEDANSGGLDDRMRELLATAYQNQIPVIFALTRARLGQALGKSLHISVLGILDAKGAQPLLTESMQLADECRRTWLGSMTGK